MFKLQEMLTHPLSSVSSPRAKILVPTAAVVVLQLLVAAVTAAAPVALPGCREACGSGSVTVPYPFGFQQGCFHTGFNLTCDEKRHPPKLFLGDGVEVEDISLAGGTMRVQSKITTFSWSYGNLTEPSIDSISSLWYGGLTTGTGMQLAVSTEHNVFVAVGCNFIAYLAANPDTAGSEGGAEYVSACAALCDNSFPAPGDDTSCSGFGCCRTSIAQGLPVYGMQFKDLDQTDDSPYTRRSPGSAFIVDREWFSGINVEAMQNNTFDDFGSYAYESHPHRVITSVPTVLDWWLDTQRVRDLDLVMLNPHSGPSCVSLNSLALQ